jgi:hypothetical protein
LHYIKKKNLKKEFTCCFQTEKRGQIAFPASAFSQLSSAQNNPGAKVAHFGVVYSGSFYQHRFITSFVLLVTYSQDLLCGHVQSDGPHTQPCAFVILNFVLISEQAMLLFIWHWPQAL